MRILRFLGGLAALGFAVAIVAGGAVVYALWHYGRTLPDYQQLANYEPPVMTRVHAGDGQLIAEYARERRLFVPIGVIPKRVVRAFLSAEDKNFYSHKGIDPLSVVRAVVVNVRNIISSRRPVGASTITQQVAKNFLLSSEVSFERKFKEAILAFRIERAFDKDRILELYLNEIYLGVGSYGVAAAALNYFDKSLDELTIAEAAYLAALPKAPNNYHPVHDAERALQRRDWVISRMYEDGHINRAESVFATREPLIARPRRELEIVSADWFTEEVRRELAKRYGEDKLYEGGLSVRTSMHTDLQRLGERVLRNGLIAYDRRHGYRGPLGNLELDADWQQRFGAAMLPAGLLEGWRAAVVLRLGAEAAEIGFLDGLTGSVPLKDVAWARRRLDDGGLGPKVKRPGDVFAVGDIVLVEEASGGEAGLWSLRQIPEVNGGLVAMDPHTGRVLALVGGWSFAASQYNRAVQANRQPGSAFKPVVYAAALDSGFTPASLVLDAPFVIDQGGGLGKWKPANYTRKFYGPSTLRLGIEKSRNLMTVRLAQYIGMDTVVDYARRMGVVDDMPKQLSMSLGAGETTLLRLTSAYAMLVNGGKRITPTLIDRIQDRRGETVFRHDQRECSTCQATGWFGQPEPRVADTRAQVLDPVTAYQVVSMLEGVVQRGTGVRVRSVGKPLAGKTGTTNESRDTWFIGFSPDLAVGVFVGFDEPASLGRRETGSSVTAPIFRDFMVGALEKQASIPFRIPRGVRIVRIDAASGLPASPGTRNAIREAFRPGTEPKRNAPVLDNPNAYQAGAARPRRSESGLY